MRREPDPVARPMAEVFVVAGCVDDIAGGPVGLETGDPGAVRRGRRDLVDRRLLGPGDQVVDREIAGRRLADEQRPGHVAPIAVDHGAEVEEKHGAFESRPIARRAVR